MLLIELMERYDENKPLYVFKQDDLLALYDGRDSIPEILNERKIKEISPYMGGFSVEII